MRQKCHISAAQVSSLCSNKYENYFSEVGKYCCTIPPKNFLYLNFQIFNFEMTLKCYLQDHSQTLDSLLNATCASPYNSLEFSHNTQS